MSNTHVLIKHVAVIICRRYCAQWRNWPAATATAGGPDSTDSKESSDQMDPAVLNTVCRVLGSSSYVPVCADHV